MFQEILNNQVINDQLLLKFPNLLRSNNSIRRFTDSTDEFNALRNGVGLRFLSDSMIIKMTGNDVLEFLHRISTNALIDLQPSEKRNTLFLNEKGRFIDRATVLSLGNEYKLLGSIDHQKRLFSWINKFIITEDIKTEDVSEKFTILEFIGSQTDSFLTLILGSEVELDDIKKIHQLSLDGFQFLLFVNQKWNDLKSFKIIIEKEHAINFINFLFSIKSAFDLMLVGEDAFDVFRIQNGIPSLPREINDRTNPYEVKLINEVNFKKGCYIGQEVIARMDTYDKVHRTMVHVTLTSKIREQNATINSNESVQIGIITSLSEPELLTEQIGLAIINKKVLHEPNGFYVQNGDKKIFIKISLLDDSK